MKISALSYFASLIFATMLGQSASSAEPTACANLQRKAIVCTATGSSFIRSIEFPAENIMATVNFADGKSEDLKQGTVTDSAFPVYGFGFSSGSVDLIPTYCQSDLEISFYWQHIVGGRAFVSLKGVESLILNCAEKN